MWRPALARMCTIEVEIVEIITKAAAGIINIISIERTTSRRTIDTAAATAVIIIIIIIIETTSHNCAVGIKNLTQNFRAHSSKCPPLDSLSNHLMEFKTVGES